ncbi:unnamed protein product, partial [Iphiclides podalirius]
MEQVKNQVQNSNGYRCVAGYACGAWRTYAHALAPMDAILSCHGRCFQAVDEIQEHTCGMARGNVPTAEGCAGAGFRRVREWGFAVPACALPVRRLDAKPDARDSSTALSPFNDLPMTHRDRFH